MHFKNPRRSIPSWLWSCRISSFFFPGIIFSSVCFFLFVPSTLSRLGIILTPISREERRGLRVARDARAAMGRASFHKTAAPRRLFPSGRLLRLFLSVTLEVPLGIELPCGRSLLMSSSGQGKGSDVLDSEGRERFEQLALPRLHAAFNLARWLLCGRAHPADASHEAMLPAYRHFNAF